MVADGRARGGATEFVRRLLKRAGQHALCSENILAWVDIDPEIGAAQAVLRQVFPLKAPPTSA